MQQLQPCRGNIVCAALRYIQIKFCSYCRRKSYAQLAMDIALLMVNAAHLTRVVRAGEHDHLRTLKIALICSSIGLEILIAVLLCFKEHFDIEDEKQHKVMTILNDIVIYLIFGSVLVHIFVSVFVEDHHPPYMYRHVNRTNCDAS